MATADLEGKRILITGGNAGIGLATATALASRGATVTIACRDPHRGATAAAKISEASGRDDVAVADLDLASLPSVNALSTRLHESGDPIDVLINNAGVVTNKRTLTGHGFETMFAVNHLGHFHLTNQLLDLVAAAAPARVVVVASHAHRFAKGGLVLDDLQSERDFGAMKTYGRSKLANLLFARTLSQRLDPSEVTVNSVHPGGVRTRLARDGDGGRIGEIAMRLASPFFRSPEKGATGSVYAAASDEVAGLTGRYFFDTKQVEPAATATDDAVAEGLWSASEALVAEALAH